jgi:cobalamin biosynthesis protein CobC
MTLWTEHGGHLDQARRRFGDTGAPWIDLSTGINPHGWPGIGGLTIDWQRLPDGEALRELEAAAARFFGTSPEYIVALPGTEIGLRLLGALIPGPARHLWPSYRTHAEMIPGSVATPAQSLEAISSGTVILANPNNPGGRVVPSEILQALLVRLARNGGWLVIDEAFADADRRHSLAGRVGKDAPLIVLRSFGKFFGLAGVRLGFLLGPPEMIAGLRERIGAWPVSAAAIAIGAAAYRDIGWITATRVRLRGDAAALDAVLAARGYNPSGTCPLFRLIETEDAQTLFERLARRSILTRPFDYDPCWLRIGLPPDADALARLDAALDDG